MASGQDQMITRWKSHARESKTAMQIVKPARGNHFFRLSVKNPAPSMPSKLINGHLPRIKIGIPDI